MHCPRKDVLGELVKCLEELLPQTRLIHDEVEECDWVAAWKEFFTPVAAGDFLILPPWRAEERGGNPLALLIEPKSAFGTGHHPTTTLCLEAISRLRREGKIPAAGTFLDLGTGTGILGIACTKLGMSGLGVDIDPTQQVSKLKTSQKQLLEISKALFFKAKLLILDEPTNGLDPSGIHEIRNLIKSLPELYDCTVLISSHMLSEIELMADDIGILNHGRLLFEGSLDELRQYALQTGFATDNFEDMFLSMIEKDNTSRKQRAKL